MNIVLRNLQPEDWQQVAHIYKEGIQTGHATFQKEPPTWEGWDKEHLKTCRVVAEIDDKVVGWAALTPISGRCVYEGVAEVSVYVAYAYRGRKIGLQILEKLIHDSEKEGIWTLQSGVFPENTASIKVHEQAGFRRIGYREKIGKMNGIWRDTVLLERRSPVVGVD